MRGWPGALVLAVCVIATVLPASADHADEPISEVVASAVDPLKVSLGKALFNDVRLSGDGSRSCATCHDIGTNGASANRFDRSSDGTQLDFNTPTIFNAALNFRLNWEGNFMNLRDHARSLIGNPKIMNADIKTVVQALKTDPLIQDLVQVAYGEQLNEDNLVDALSVYEKSLVLTDSPFDRWLAGDQDALSAAEKQGYRRFKEVGCASCHQGRNVGGNLFQRYGIFHPLTASGPERVRVPSLRTVYYTPPYFHDGSADTLEKAIRAMGEAQLNVALDDEDVENISAFLKSLAGSYAGGPLQKGPP